MLTRPRVLAALLLLALFAVVPAGIVSQMVSAVTSPRQQFGAAIGDDYFLVTYSQLEDYWKKLDRESDRMTMVDIGRTEEGRRQWMAVITAPENGARLERYREISRRLSLADGLTDDQARALAAEGKAVVWIDGGQHADEVLGAQQLIELVYELTSRSDPETLRILRDVIVLAVHANPDGHDLVANWYMRDRDPRRRTLVGLPRAYQKYVGHDNNRDFYMSTQAETINMNRVLYRDWFPQIVYNHHQTAPPGTVMFAPPFRDPFNYVFDPLVPAGIDFVGAAMHSRFAAEGKAGVTMRSGSTYSTWWNGGLRTTAYFHNQIGLLTETIGDPTPTVIPSVARTQVASADLPFPIAPQPWRFRQSIEYSMTANRAVLDLASRYRETLLFNIYRMGKNAIERGRRDTWTSPGAAATREPQQRDPRGYILPADQPDFLTATKFIDALLKNGVAVSRATAAFSAAGRQYPAGSYVVTTAQPFRPHVLDMFEPQRYPNDIPFPGAPPTPPYDNAGWTLAFQMGIRVDRILDAFDGPFVAINAATPPAGLMSGVPLPAGYLVSHQQNDAFIAVNRLLAAGEDVYWPRDRSVGGGDGGGAMYIPATASTLPRLRAAAADLGLSFTGVAAAPAGEALRLRPVRVALWDRYGGASSSGWIRWLLERFEFPFEVVYVQDLNAGGLAQRFDVLILPDEAVPLENGGVDGSRIDNLPPEYRRTTGTMTWNVTVPRLQQFVEEGGTLVTIGGSTAVAERIGVQVSSALVATDRTGIARPLGREDYYIPGSILRVSVDNRQPIGYGFAAAADVFFDNSPVFRIATCGVTPCAPQSAPRRVAWFASPAPLRSGWAWGQRYLDGGVAVVDAPLGQGHVLLFGPEIVYRGQSHGSFKFLFNGMFAGHALPVASVVADRDRP